MIGAEILMPEWFVDSLIAKHIEIAPPEDMVVMTGYRVSLRPH